MKKAYIFRGPSTDEGTFGWLMAGDFMCRTLELPWRNNTRKLSCIPTGSYTCVIVKSPRFGEVYHVTGVPGRDAILIHSGNYAGRIPQHKSHVQGCILTGAKVGIMAGQKAVFLSKTTLNRFMKCMEYKPFVLEVIDGSDIAIGD